MVSIARENLFANIPRLLIAQAGILFAVSLVTLQTGIYSGFGRSASALISQSRADIWVTPRNVNYLGVGVSIPLSYEALTQAQQLPGVSRVEAVIFRTHVWRSAQDQLTAITVVGLDPAGELFYPLNLTRGQQSELSTPYHVLADQSDLKTLEISQVGDRGMVGGLPARVVGLTRGVQSIIFSPILFTALPSARAYTTTPLATHLPCNIAKGVECRSPAANFPPQPRALNASDAVSFLLVRTVANVDLHRLKQQLESTITYSRAWTQTEFAQSNQAYWERRSNIGVILGLGATIGVVVGIVVVGQILHASVSEHIKQFGTLRAMGASRWVIYRVIGEQALWMAVLGYVPGILLSLAVAQWAVSRGILILISPTSAVGIFGITVLMCFTAAAFAIRKVTKVDPVMVFRN